MAASTASTPRGQITRRGADALFPLPTWQALAVATFFGLLGAAADTMLSNEVRTLFAVGFSLGAALAVLLVRRPDIVRTIVWLPLIYLVLLLIGAGVSGRHDAVSWLLLAFVFKAPVVLIATGVAIVLGAARLLGTRHQG